MRVPDYADPTPAYQQIAADLRARIKAAEYNLGGRLPSNKALVTAYGVSEGTVRAALDELRAEGIVATQSTRGTYVVGMPRKPADDDSAMAIAQMRDEVRDFGRRMDALGPEELRAALVRLELNLIDLYGKLGFDYPREDEVPSQDTGTAAHGNSA
jgi:DNA-binding GntR family transcriptional regulator